MLDFIQINETIQPLKPDIKGITRLLLHVRKRVLYRIRKDLKGDFPFIWLISLVVLSLLLFVSFIAFGIMTLTISPYLSKRKLINFIQRARNSEKK